MNKADQVEAIQEWIKSLPAEEVLKDRRILINEDGYTNQLLLKDSFKIEKQYRMIKRIFIYKDKACIEFEIDDSMKTTRRVIVANSDYYNEAKKIMNGTEFKDVKSMLNAYARKKGLDLKVVGITFILKSIKNYNAPEHRFWIQNKRETSHAQDIFVKHHKKEFKDLTNYYLNKTLGEIL